MADDARIRLTIQLIGEIAQKHVEQKELIAEAKSLLAGVCPDTFLGRQLRATPPVSKAETPAFSIPPSWVVDNGPAEI